MIDYSTPPPVVVVVTRPLPRDKGMAADHGVLEAWAIPQGLGPESRQRASGANSP